MSARAIEHTAADRQVVRALAPQVLQALAGVMATPAANGAAMPFAPHRAETGDPPIGAGRELSATAAHHSAQSAQSFSRQSRINDQPIAQKGRSSRSS